MPPVWPINVAETPATIPQSLGLEWTTHAWENTDQALQLVPSILPEWPLLLQGDIFTFRSDVHSWLQTASTYTGRNAIWGSLPTPSPTIPITLKYGPSQHNRAFLESRRSSVAPLPTALRWGGRQLSESLLLSVLLCPVCMLGAACLTVTTREHFKSQHLNI